MANLKKLWQETKTQTETKEQEIIQLNINFLRQVAQEYVNKGRRVFFNENKVAHYAEAGFGRLIIEDNADEQDVLGDTIFEIDFEPAISTDEIAGYLEITADNLDQIKFNLVTE